MKGRRWGGLSEFQDARLKFLAASENCQQKTFSIADLRKVACSVEAGSLPAIRGVFFADAARRQLRGAGELHVRSFLSLLRTDTVPWLGGSGGHDAGHLRLARRIHAGFPRFSSGPGPGSLHLSVLLRSAWRVGEWIRARPIWRPRTAKCGRGNLGHWRLKGLHHLLGCFLFAG